MTLSGRSVFSAIAKARENAKGEFEHLPQGLARTGFGLQLFGHDEALALQFGDALLVAGNDALAGRLDDAVQQGGCLLLDLCHAAADRLAHDSGLFAQQVPDAAGHVLGQIEHRFRGLDTGQQPVELTLDLFAPDGLAVVPARAVEAHVVRMLLAGLALGPAGRQRLAADAQHEAPQRKAGVEIDAGRDFRLAVQTLLHALIRLQRDERRMPGAAQARAPLGPFQMTAIQNAREGAVDILTGPTLNADERTGAQRPLPDGRGRTLSTVSMDYAFQTAHLRIFWAMVFTRSIRAVVFDMDGLLIDTEAGFRDSLIAVAAERGHDLPISLFYQLLGVPNADSVGTLRAHFGPDFDAEGLFAACWVRFHESVDLANLLKTGVRELLDCLDELNVSKAIATSAPRDSVEKHLGPSRIVERFDSIIIKGDYVRSKPAPDPYLVAAERLGVNPIECLALEDSHNGVRAAHAAGMMTIMVPDLLAPTDEMHEKCVHIAETLHDVRDLLFDYGPDGISLGDRW